MHLCRNNARSTHKSLFYMQQALIIILIALTLVLDFRNKDHSEHSRDITSNPYHWPTVTFPFTFFTFAPLYPPDPYIHVSLLCLHSSPTKVLYFKVTCHACLQNLNPNSKSATLHFTGLICVYVCEL